MRILFQGDSVTDAGRNYSDPDDLGPGYPKYAAERLGELFPEKEFVFFNRGISGNRSSQLLTRLQSQAVSRTLMAVFTQTDNTSGHVAFILIFCSHITGSRTAKAHRQTETLCRAANNICAPSTRSLQQSQRHQICNYGHFDAFRVASLNKGSIIFYCTISIRKLYQSIPPKEQTKHNRHLRVRYPDLQHECASRFAC